MREYWISTGRMYVCPNCHQYSAEVCAWVIDGDTNPGLDCPECGWSHKASQWFMRRCPEGCLMVQPEGKYDKRGYDGGWNRVELPGEVLL